MIWGHRPREVASFVRLMDRTVLEMWMMDVEREEPAAPRLRRNNWSTRQPHAFVKGVNLPIVAQRGKKRRIVQCGRVACS